MAIRRDQPAFDEPCCSMQVREVENLDLGPYPHRFHQIRKLFHQCGRILINDRRKVDGARRDRRHIGPKMQGATALACAAAAPTGRELYDHAGAMAAYAFLHGCEKVGIRGWQLVFVTDMDVDEARAGLESFVGAFHLLGRGDREGRIVALARHGAGDRHRDHHRFVDLGDCGGH